MTISSFRALTFGLALALPATGFAQAQNLTGTVGAIFDNQFTVTTTEGQVLVTATEGADLPQAGQIVRLTGTQDGNSFAATEIATVAAEAVTPPANTAPVTGRAAEFGFVQTLAQVDEDDDEFFGQLPDGTWVEVEYDDGRIEEIKASEGTAIPAEVLDMVLPAALRNNERLTALARITEIALDSDGDTEIDGYDADGMEVELEFDRSGELEEIKMGRDNRRSPTLETATERLTAEGYTDLGWAHRAGRHIEVIARNPFDEMVLVRLDEDGRVSRERALR